MRPIDRYVNDWVKLPSPYERQRARLARMRHIVWLSIKTMERMGAEDSTRIIMYTLTYAGVDDWTPNHISGFCRWLRDTGHKGTTWVAELQKRGAVHYHVLSLLPIGVKWKKPTSDRGWEHGFTWVTDEINHPMYVMKYLQKGTGNGRVIRFPAGLRLYGLSQSVTRRMSFEDSVSYRESNLPSWFWQGADDDCAVRAGQRVRGGVAVRGMVAISRYTREGIRTIDAIGEQMYTAYSI